MKKYLLMLFAALTFWSTGANAQCSTTNATSCVCLNASSINCDLLPDIIVGRPPLLVTGSNGVIEYSQTGNGAENGRLRVSVTTPNIGRGPLEIRATNIYICGTDTITGTPPATCPNSGLPPRQLVKQRVYQKSGNTMNFYDRDAGSMTYHPTHGHMHVDEWGTYSLRTNNGDPNPLNWPLIGNGAKLGFCLMDYGSCSTYNGHCVDSLGNTLINSNFPNYGLGGGQYNCSSTVQGISSGYTDIYYQYLDGMYINIPPGTCNGNYFIVVNIDPNNYFLEENENNNIIVVPYTLTKQAGTTPVITASGSTSLCPGSTVTLTSSTASSYLWSTGATTQSIVVSQPGTYTVTVDVNSPCPATSLPFIITPQSMVVTVTPSSPALCPGQSTFLNTIVTPTQTGTVQSPFTNNTVYNIPDNNSTGIASPLTISGVSPSTLSSGTIFSVQVNITHPYVGDLRLFLISPSGNSISLSDKRGGSGDNYNNTTFSMSATLPIQNGTPPFSGTYIPEGSFSSLTGNVNGIWQLKVVDNGNLDLGTINSWTLSLNNVVPVQCTYSWSSNPAGFSSTLANPSVTPTANTTYSVNVVNPYTGCAASGNTSVSLTPVALTVSPDVSICINTSTTLTASGANTYNWSPSTGLSGTTGSSVNANPLVTTTYTVTGTNTNGCTAEELVTVTVNNLPVVSLAPLASICYNAPAITLTGGAPAGGVYSGPGVSNGMFNPLTAGIGTHVISYFYSDVIGCSGTATTTISVNNCGCTLPKIPGSITGLTKICPNTPTVYSIANVASATSYTWLPPANMTIISGQGTNSVTVMATSNYVPGPLSVVSNNACGSSLPRSKTISKFTATTPGAVQGEKYGHCDAVVNLSVSPIATAVSYNWTLPAGATLISGQGTTAISFSTPPGFVSGQVCVTSFNGCLTSASRCAKIYGAPVRPVIGGANFACPGETKTYFVNPSYGATTYNWFVPTGSTIVSGQGTNSISLTFGASTGTIKCTAKNACGNKGAATIYVVNSCRQVSNAEFDVIVNPNPASESAIISLPGASGSNVVVTITNVLGKDLYSEKFDFAQGESIPLNLRGLASGMYFVTVYINDMKKITRLIVE